MPGFASYDDLIQEMTTNGKRDSFTFFKAALGTAGIAGVHQSLWTAGGWPSAGSNPASGAGTNCTGGTTNGGMWFPNVSTDRRFGVSFGAASSVACNLVIYDRLCHTAMSGTNALTTSGTKTVTMTAPRYTGTNGYDNQLWVEFTTGITTNPLQIQVSSYTDADSAGSLSGAITSIATASGTVGCMWPLPLSGGKRGITAVSTVTYTGTAPAAGACNIVLMKPLIRIPLIANTWNEKDLVMQLMSLPRIEDGACLAFAVQNTGTGQPPPYGELVTAYG